MYFSLLPCGEDMDQSSRWQCTQLVQPSRHDTAACCDAVTRPSPGKTGRRRPARAASGLLLLSYPTVSYLQPPCQRRRLNRLHQSGSTQQPSLNWTDILKSLQTLSFRSATTAAILILRDSLQDNRGRPVPECQPILDFAAGRYDATGSSD